jgi:hypothetical protein
MPEWDKWLLPSERQRTKDSPTYGFVSVLPSESERLEAFRRHLCEATGLDPDAPVECIDPSELMDAYVDEADDDA